MDMKKIGSFLKSLRKEKSLTQEQLAEIFGVAGRTVSRWENASNMPDLSILIQISEFFDVEIREILDGERKSECLNKELKETLSKVAGYDRAKKEKIGKINLTAFIVTILVGVLILLAQFVIFRDIRFIIGEAIILFIGGTTAVIMTVYSGLWNEMANNKTTILKDLNISVIMSAIFTCAVSIFIYKLSGSVEKTVIFSICFFTLIFMVGFIVLRILSAWSKRRELKNAAIDGEK